MKIIQNVLLFVCVLFISTMQSQHQSTDQTVIGSWKVQEIQYIYADTTYIANESDYGRFMFTEHNYSVIYNPRMQLRTAFKSLSKPDDKETIAAFRSIAFNAGTYLINNDVLTNTPDMAKVPGFEGGKQIYKISRQNEQLELTMFDETYPDGTKPQWFGSLKIKFILQKE